MDEQGQQDTLGDVRISYLVKTDHFEGPLDLLLTLIEKRKLFINDFSLAKVADDYIEHIRRFDTFPLNDVANFLIIASTLVLLKSKSILPTLDLTQDEKNDIDDLRRRLAMYEMFRNLSLCIKAKYGKNLIYERNGNPDIISVFAPDRRISLPQMSQSIADILRALPKKQIMQKATIKKVVSIEEMMTRLTTRVTRALKTSFGQFSTYAKGKSVPKDARIEIIVSFLAMLELVKQGVVHVSQHEDYGDIIIETESLGTPQYT